MMETIKPANKAGRCPAVKRIMMFGKYKSCTTYSSGRDTPPSPTLTLRYITPSNYIGYSAHFECKALIKGPGISTQNNALHLHVLSMMLTQETL